METAIFFGAGASKADGALLQDEIFYKYFTSSTFKQSIDDTDRELATFFYFMFGLDVDHEINKNTLFPTFEEALGILDLAATREESFKEFDGLNTARNSNRIGHLRNHFILLMAKALRDNLKDNEYHNLLIDNLIKSKLINDVVFVSTNYDILIDNAIKRKSREIDYGVNLLSFKKNQSPVKLYKLHGSLNWLYCPVCKNLTITSYRKSVADLMDDVSKKCNYCDELQTPIIIPPTYFKEINNVFLNAVWHNTEQLLTKVKHIVFCGYSFPEADMHIKYLLKRVETNKNYPFHVTVFNSYEGKSCKEKNEEFNKYNRFFIRKVEYKDKSFEDFAKSPAEFLLSN